MTTFDLPVLPDSSDNKLSISWRHGEIVSLWDMYNISGLSIYKASVTFFSNANMENNRSIEESFSMDSFIKFEASYQEKIVNNTTEFIDQAVSLGADLTAKSLRRFLAGINQQNMTGSKYIQLYKEIDSRFRDEMQSIRFLLLDKKYQKYYEDPLEYFPYNIEDKFEGVTEELDNAGKCLALEQGTACIFHLMRAMERSVKELGTALGIQNVDKEWGKILSEVDAKIKSMSPGAKKDEWSECRSNLYHVKQAWRNSTMHPKKTYSLDEAENVFRAVSAFMTQLSSLV